MDEFSDNMDFGVDDAPLDNQVSFFETDPNLGLASENGDISNELVDDVSSNNTFGGNELTTETPEIIEDDTNLAGNDVNEQLPGQMDMFEEDTTSGSTDITQESGEEIPEDTQSDLEKVNHPDMTLEEVQKLQGVKENEDGNLETTGEGTGNEAFKKSLPDDYQPNEIELQEGKTREDFDAKYDEVNKPLEDEIHDEWVERLESENADRDEIGMAHTGWKEYRDDIKDNPDYFDEEGNFKWPENEGFADEGDLDGTSSIEAGREVTRYGFDDGHYMTDADADYDSLGLPYKEEFMPKNTYSVEENIDNAYEGEIADLQEGDGTGGGNQIWTPNDSTAELERDGKLKLNNK